MDKLKAMQYFCCICSSGSFSAAARQTEVPVSTLSRSIQALESDLGAELLKRSTRHVSLTEIGKVYLEQCLEIISSIDRAEAQVGSYQNKPAGKLRISSLPYFGEIMLLPLLEQFQNNYPEITLDLEFSTGLSDLNRDGVDIAFRGGVMPDGRIISSELIDNTHRLCATPSYLATHGTPTNVYDLAGHHGLVYRAPKGILHWNYENNGSWMTFPINAPLVSNSITVIKEALLNHKGLAMLPIWIIQEQLINEQVVWVPISEKLSVLPGDPKNKIHLLYQQSQYTIPKIKVAVDFFKEQLKLC